MESFYFLPNTRHIKRVSGEFDLSSVCTIFLDTEEPQSILFSAKALQRSIREAGFPEPVVTSSRHQLIDEKVITLKIDPGIVGHLQGYRISMQADSITIVGNETAGLFYGICTLTQLNHNTKKNHSRALPNLDIYDWPDFPARGVMLDISRDKVPTMDTLFRLVDLFASLKLNQLQLYTEHTFAYQHHPLVWAGASPMTSDEVLLLDAYCKTRFIELVPNQNSFGHMHRWLALPEYESLGELYQVGDVQWWGKGSFSLCPEDPRSLQLISGLYQEILPLFSSSMVNVGCDETFDLGLGRSKSACEARGKGHVYLDFLTKIYHEVESHQKTMQYWGDIVLQHPELIAQLPKDAIALEWGYEANHPFEENTRTFSEAGVPFYVCPGTSSWNTIAGRTKNMLMNIANAAVFGMKNGAIGLLNTDWGDNGHWQALPISYPGYAAGAAYSWCATTVDEDQFFDALSLQVFLDPTGNSGELLSELGNVYQISGKLLSNASIFFRVLQSPLAECQAFEIRSSDLRELDEKITTLRQLLSKCSIRTDDQDMVTRELTYTMDLLEHAGKRLSHLLDPTGVTTKELSLDLGEIIEIFQEQWLARNRKGGLKDSLERFVKMGFDYQ